MLRQILILEATADDPVGRIARERADVEALLTDFDVGIVWREVRERLGLDPNETPNERNPE